jgi:hypothetical protein
MKSINLLMAAGLMAFTAASSAATPPPSKPGGAQSELGMVIRGDQEAPLVLYIVPWQDSRMASIPEAPLLPLPPRVHDHDRSLVNDPAMRSLNPQRAKNK